MSVLIKGMEMPDNCGACPLETDYGTCGYYSLFVEAGHDSEIWKRRDDCPLVEVPPHGRLIDADALTQDGWVLSRFVPVDGVFTSQEMPINCKSVPTIIKAEGGRVNGF